MHLRRDFYDRAINVIPAQAEIFKNVCMLMEIPACAGRRHFFEFPTELLMKESRCDKKVSRSPIFKQKLYNSLQKQKVFYAL